MRDLFQRTISIFIVFCLTITAIPLNSLASTPSGSPSTRNENKLVIDSNINTEDESVYEYTINGKNEATITKYKGSAASVVIPESIDGCKIISIADSAFANQNTIRSIVIPHSVTSIGNYAFKNCSLLSNIDLGSGVQTLGFCVFMNDTNLTEITIPASVKNCSISPPNPTYYMSTDSKAITIYSGTELEVTTTGIGSFGGSYIKTVCFPENIQTVPANIFAYDKCLTEIVFSAEITSIGDEAFHGCSSLNKVSFPDALKSIGINSFRQCSSLSSVSFPDSLISIGNNAFRACSDLKLVEFGSGLKTIGEAAFSYCSKIESVALPNCVTSISNYAFLSCSSLSSIHLGTGLQTLGYCVFMNDVNLKEIIIPSSLRTCSVSPPNPTYYMSSDSKAITIYKGTDYEVTATEIGPFGGSYIEKVVFDSDVQNVPDNCFVYAKYLSDIVFFEGLKNIKENAFRECINLRDIYYEGSEDQWNAVSIGKNNYNPNNITLHFGFTPIQLLEGFQLFSAKSTNSISLHDSVDFICGYYQSGKVPYTNEGYLVVNSAPSIISISQGEWIPEKGWNYTITGLSEGDALVTFTNVENGDSAVFEFLVFPENNVFTFNNLPCDEIEQGKITHFYNFGGMVINDFEYVPYLENDIIKYYDVEFTVYNSSCMYGSACSYDKNGKIYNYYLIDKMTEEPTSFTKTLIALYYNVEDLYYGLKNKWYYSGESVSKETVVHLQVPPGGYITISNNAKESDFTALVNTIYLTLELCGTISKFESVFVSNGTLEDTMDKIMKELPERFLTNEYFLEMLEDPTMDAFKKAFMLRRWDLYSAKEYLKTVSDAFREAHIDFLKEVLDSIASVTGISELSEDLFFSLLPTGWAINALFASQKLANTVEFMDAFFSSCDNPKAIYIYAPVLDKVYHSNGIEVKPTSGELSDNIVVHTYKIGFVSPLEFGFYPSNNVHFYEYNISMYQDNINVQPDSPVTVQIPLPKVSGLMVPLGYVYRLNDDGSYTKINARIENDFILFETDHFSFYLLTDEPLETIPTSPSGHIWGDWTRIDDAKHQRVCINNPIHVETGKHSWDNGSITSPATCKNNGVKTFICLLCNATKTETIQRTNDHKWNLGEITKPATPTAEGEKTYTCTECGAVRTEPLARLPEEQPAFTPGDLDFDGKVSAADARLALRASVKLESFWNDPASPVFLAADADGDGKITAADARKILRVSVKLETFA